MKKVYCFLFIFLSVGFFSPAQEYKNVTTGNWPFTYRGISFSPNFTDKWKFSKNGIPEGYGIYFYREGKDSLPFVEEGGLQFNNVSKAFAGNEQLINHLTAMENLTGDPSVTLLNNEMFADKKFGDLCVWYNRTFRSVKNNTDTVYIVDAGYYFVHPKNKSLIVKAHLFHRSKLMKDKVSFGVYVDGYYKNVNSNVPDVPAWTIGGGVLVGVGSSGNDIYFGYNDSKTNEQITIDPGASRDFHFSLFRRIKGIFIGGVELSASNNSSSLSATYQNLEGTTSKGGIIKFSGGAYLLSKHRARVRIKAGPMIHTNPKMTIVEKPTNAGTHTVTFKYKSAVGFQMGFDFVLVNRKYKGQWLFGIEIQKVNYQLSNFKVDNSTYSPDLLNPQYNAFKNPNGSAVGVLMCGYQFFIQ